MLEVSTTRSTQKYQKQLQIKQLEVSSLLEVTQAINNNLTADKLFRIYEFILRAQISVKNLAVLIREEGEYFCLCSYGFPPEIDFTKAIPSLLPIKNLAYLNEERALIPKEVEIVIPVYHNGEPIAFALIGQPKLDRYETLEEKIKFIQTITNIIVVAIENKRLFRKQLEQERFRKELELAGQVQGMLIPSQLPNNDHVEMSAIYLPHRNIGGDYYDYIEQEDSIIYCIADISGKGIAAAILMANFQAILRSLIKDVDDMVDFICQLNNRILEITKGERFITFFIAKYKIKERKLIYCNAGHNPPLLFQNETLTELADGTTILGMFEELPEIMQGEVELDDGHAVLINYTDGITDLENNKGDTYSEKRLQRFVKNNHRMNMDDFNRKLMQEIMVYKGETLFPDDITVLSCRFKA